MLYHLDVGHIFDQFVVDCAQKIKHAGLPAGSLDPADNPVALLPLFHKTGYQLHRILKVTAHADRAISRGLTQTMEWRIKLSEIRDIKNRFYFFIFSADFFQLVPRAVRGTIVDKQYFIVVPGKGFLQHVDYRIAHRFYVFHFVIAGNHHADFFLFFHVFLILKHFILLPIYWISLPYIRE